MKIAVTGGRGRLAPIAAEHFRSLGWDVTLFSREGGDGLAPLAGLRSGEGSFDAVVHFAWSTVPFTAEARPSSWEEDDLPLLRDLLAREDGHFVFLSSAAIYGDTGPEPADESTPPKPLGAYARNKLLAEDLVLHASGDRPAAVLRVSNLIGERGNPALPQGVLPRLIAAALGGDPVTIWGDGHATKDYLPCPDLCRAIERAVAGRLDGIFNVASGESLSLLELIGLVEGGVGRPVPRTHAPHYPWDVSFSRVSGEKLRMREGWAPRLSVREAIGAIIAGAV